MRKRTFAAVAWLSLLAPATATAADELSTSNRLEDRRFVTVGPRAYELGTEAGRYPAAGFHTRGEMGGVWTPPIKLVDGIWFGLDGEWIGPARRFTSGYGHVKMRLPRTGGLRVERTDFVPGERRGVLVGLKLEGKAKQKVRLRMQTHSELMSIYPWGETKTAAGTEPLNQLTFNLPDTVGLAGRALVFGESGRPVPEAPAHDWGAAVGSDLTPTRARTGDGFRGPQGNVDLPRLRPWHAAAARRAVRRHRVRQGQGRPAHLQAHAPALRPHHRVVRRRGLRRTAPAARAASCAGCWTTRPARCAPSCASARRSPATRSSTCRATACSSAASSGASRTLPTRCRRRATSSCARSTAARTTRRPRRRWRRRASSAQASPTIRGCSPPTVSSPPSHPSLSASSSRSRSTCGASRRRRSSSTTPPARSSTRW